MKKPASCLRLSILLALTVLGLPAYGEDVSNPATATSPVASSTAPKPKSSSFDVDFRGGSLAQLVAAINTAGSGPFNLMGEKADQDAQLPPMTLQNVEPVGLATALSTFLRPRGLTVSLAWGNIFVVAKTGYVSATNAAASATFQTFQLTPYLTTLSVDNITDAIKTAWASDSSHDAKLLRFQYHSATKLLFVYGPPEALAVATQVIPQLNPTATARARFEYLAPSSEILGPTFGDEKARLDRLAEELARRKDAREAAARAAAAPTK